MRWHNRRSWVASDVTVVVLKDTGHWVLEERPKETREALLKFL
jgi:pimeloyl-ACP methyl ester carboxylesterase